MQARTQWGHPKSLDDLTSFFTAYLHSSSATTPFSSAPLSGESHLIIPQLERLTRRGWWTVGSQPAVDAASSEDDLVGWGPKGGYIFQKAFVEFFAEKEVVIWLKDRIHEQGHGLVSFYAGNLKVGFRFYRATFSELTPSMQGDLESNVNYGDKTAVTWGVFPGHEIAQSTIIERENFLSWKVGGSRTVVSCVTLMIDVCRKRPSRYGLSGHRYIHRDRMSASYWSKFDGIDG